MGETASTTHSADPPLHLVTYRVVYFTESSFYIQSLRFCNIQNVFLGEDDACVESRGVFVEQRLQK